MQKHFINSNTTVSFCIAAFFILFTLTSCEKEVKIKLDDGEAQLVVEGGIETGFPPVVVLTKSIGYFAKIDLNTLQNSFVHDAQVTVSDGSRTITLKEYALDTGSSGNTFYIYTIDTALSPSEWLIGQTETFYKLTITTKDGKTYESHTKIPTPTELDSVVSTIPPIIPQNNPNVRQIKIYFKEPDTFGNHVRYFTKRNNEPFYPGLNSVYSDELINGTYFETFLSAGESRASTAGFDSLGYFYPGDSVTLKWCAIDKQVFDFYSSFEYSIGTLGNPFSTPIRVKSNISNGGLGVWAGYGAIYKSLVIK